MEKKDRISGIKTVTDGFFVRSFDMLTVRELYEIMRARADVFVGEEKILYPDADGIDTRCLHVYSTGPDGTVTAYLRMYPKEGESGVVQMGRVLTSVHGTGLGLKLLKAGMQAAAHYMHAVEIYVESQKHAQGFYQKSGFVVTSEDFIEAGIVHVQMRLRLYPDRSESKMKLTMLGTGHATVTKCYNTCFVIEDRGKYFMVDGGGGNTVLHQLAAAGLDWKEMRTIFVTHKHLDHLVGILWMIRMITQGMHHDEYDGEAVIYAHDEVISLLQKLSDMLLPAGCTRFIGSRLHLIEVKDGETRKVNGRDVTFFDIHSTKTKQFGFFMDIGGRRLTCCGDEPYNRSEEKYAAGSDWLLHEAFCLHAEADIFDPYEKHHSTVLDAAGNAQTLHVKNLLLYHTEDQHLDRRRELYTAEAAARFDGNIFVPDDLETIEL